MGVSALSKSDVQCGELCYTYVGYKPTLDISEVLKYT